LRRELLRLLREDEEFRLAVAGLLGLDEVLRELKKLREDFNNFVKEQAKRWEENNKRWEEADRRFEVIFEELKSLREELKALREDHKSLREELKSLREDHKSLREELKALREDHKSLREELKALREDHNKLREDFNNFVKEEMRRWEENNRRWEENNKRWEENNKRWEEADRRFRWLMSALVEIRDSLGGAFEYYTANVVKAVLSERGFPCDVRVGVTLPIDGFREMDVFCPDPLVVGEVTVSLRTVDEAEREVGKLLSNAEAAERFVGREVYLKVLAVENVPIDVVEHLRRRAKELDIYLITGREY